MKSRKKYSSNDREEFDKKMSKKRAESARSIIKEHNISTVINVNMFRIPLESIKTELKDIKKIIHSPEKQKEEEKLLIKNTNIKIAKENIIMSLRKELKFQKLIYRNLLNFKQYADKNSSLYKINYENICKYKKQLFLDLSDFIRLCDDYEKRKNECEVEKNTIITTNENLINYKNQEQEKMKIKLNKLNGDTERQHNIIEGLRNKLREFRNQNNDYILNMEKNEAEHDQRYEMLLNEYKRVENEYRYYYDLELRGRKNRLDGMNKNLMAEEEGLAMLRLSDKQVKGQFLKNIIKDINSQIQEIEQLNKRRSEDRETEKLLGKVGAEKFRQRMTEKYNNEMTNIYSKYKTTLSSKENVKYN